MTTMLQARIIEHTNLGYSRLVSELIDENKRYGLLKYLLGYYTVLCGINAPPVVEMHALHENELIPKLVDFYRKTIESTAETWFEEDVLLLMPDRYFRLHETCLLLLGLTELCKLLRKSKSMENYLHAFIEKGDRFMAGIEKMHIGSSGFVHAVNVNGAYPRNLERNWLAGLACFATLAWGQFRLIYPFEYDAKHDRCMKLYLQSVRWLYEINERNIGHFFDTDDNVQIDQSWLLQANALACRSHINEPQLVGNFALTIGHICNLRDVRNTPKKLSRRLQALASYVIACPGTDQTIIDLVPKWAERLVDFIDPHDAIIRDSNGQFNLSAQCHTLLGLIRFLEVSLLHERNFLLDVAPTRASRAIVQAQ
jgi:hypothetical protein